jgi:hypothetical protein
MDTILAADQVRLALRDAGYQDWEGGRPGFVVAGDPQGGWVGVNFFPAFPGFPGARRRRERGLQKFRDVLSAAGFTVTDSPYTPGVLRVTLPPEAAGA